MRIYEINEQFKKLYEMSENVEVDEETGEIIDNSKMLTQLFDDLNIELCDKLDNTNYIIKELEVAKEALRSEAKRLTDKAKVFENRQNYLKSLIRSALEASGQSKIKSKFSFSISKRKSYNYDDVNMFGLSDDFIRVKKEIDKTEIKEFIKAGGSIDGVKEVENTTLSIR